MPLEVPVASRFGRHLVEYLCDHDFDSAHVTHVQQPYGGKVARRYPTPDGELNTVRETTTHEQGLPHGFAFIVKRLFDNQPRPILPVFQNTCYPPNQPTREALVSARPGDRRSGQGVGRAGAGGGGRLRRIEPLRGRRGAGPQAAGRAGEQGRGDAYSALPKERLYSATSESLNWVAVGGAMEQDALQFDLVDYVPVYRTPANTGGGWAFGRWQIRGHVHAETRTEPGADGGRPGHADGRPAAPLLDAVRRGRRDGHARRSKPVRLMGEDLVLYKDQSGNYGLVDRHCPHRRADMSYGWVEECGLRCNYHGWKFDHTGACIDQPFEEIAHPDARFKERITIKAYPVEARAGLLWAYMGPQPAPRCRTGSRSPGATASSRSCMTEIPCNWFQCQENSIDPVHFEWLHDNWGQRLRGQTNGTKPPTPPAGRASTSSSTASPTAVFARASPSRTSCGRSAASCLWPNCLFTGNHFEWRVPIDDDNTLSVGWFFDRVPEEMEPFRQERIPYWYGPIKDEQTGRWLDSHVMNQDFVAWVGQGTIADRTQEHLGESDRGIILMRRRMLEEAEKVRAGRSPKSHHSRPAGGAIRRAADHRPRLLPGRVLDARRGRRQRRRSAIRSQFVFQAGQPEEITAAYREAMGMDPDGTPRLSEAGVSV